MNFLYNTNPELCTDTHPRSDGHLKGCHCQLWVNLSEWLGGLVYCSSQHRVYNLWSNLHHYHLLYQVLHLKMRNAYIFLIEQNPRIIQTIFQPEVFSNYSPDEGLWKDGVAVVENPSILIMIYYLALYTFDFWYIFWHF